LASRSTLFQCQVLFFSWSDQALYPSFPITEHRSLLRFLPSAPEGHWPHVHSVVNSHPKDTVRTPSPQSSEKSSTDPIPFMRARRLQMQGHFSASSFRILDQGNVVFFHPTKVLLSPQPSHSPQLQSVFFASGCCLHPHPLVRASRSCFLWRRHPVEPLLWFPFPLFLFFGNFLFRACPGPQRPFAFPPQV